MKKNYLAIVAAGLFSVQATAQQSNGLAVQTKTLDMSVSNAVEEPREIGFSGLRAPGDTIWFNDFSDPTDWTIDNEVGNSDDWVIGTNGPSGTFPTDPLESTSGGNFALFDSDLLCSGNQVANIYTADAIDLSGNQGVLIQFEQYYRRFVDSCYVLVSTDGVNWTKFEVNAGVAVNATVPNNPQLTQVNISAVAGGQATVYIGFQFYSPAALGANAGCSYAWQVDDVALVESQANDLILNKTYHGDVINDWEYEVTPLAQAQSKVLGVVVTNNGSATQTTVECEYDIVFDGSSVNSGSFAVGDGTINPAETDTGWFDTGFVPSEIGTYTVTYTIVSAEGDALPENNTIERDFEMTEFEWSHEREDLWDGQYGGYIVPDSDPQEMQEYAHGSVFVPVVDADLYAIKVSFGDLTSATPSTPLALTAEVHTFGANIQDIVESEVQAVDVFGTGWQTFVLDDPISLTAGTGYILAVRTTGGEDVMVINGWGVDDDFGAANYGPFGTGGAENWFNGWDYSSAIRAVFNPDVASVNENEDVSGLNIFPNPTSDDLKVNFTAKENQDMTVQVIGSNGALVASRQLNVRVGQLNRVEFDMSNLAGGIYMVQLVGRNGMITKRVIVQ